MNNNIQAGVRVYVDFVSESSTQFSGNRFSGNGVIDLVDGGYIYGRLDSGAPFMCMESDVTLVQDKIIKKPWMKSRGEHKVNLCDTMERMIVVLNYIDFNPNCTAEDLHKDVLSEISLRSVQRILLDLSKKGYISYAVDRHCLHGRSRQLLYSLHESARWIRSISPAQMAKMKSNLGG